MIQIGMSLQTVADPEGTVELWPLKQQEVNLSQYIILPKCPSSKMIHARSATDPKPVEPFDNWSIFLSLRNPALNYLNFLTSRVLISYKPFSYETNMLSCSVIFLYYSMILSEV